MQEYRAKVLGNDTVARATRKLAITLDLPFTYKSGQFITMRIPGTENSLLGRSYSVASRLGEQTLELLIRIVEGGVGSAYVDQLKPGDEVKFMGPFGKFVLSETPSDVLFVGTGTGVGPFIPMIDEVLNRDANIKVTLLMGYREEQDMLVQTKSQVWHELFPGFEAITCLSRASAEWMGVRGRVTDYLRNNPSLMAGRQIYICGNGGMVGEVLSIALEQGVPREKIMLEKYNNI